MTRGLLKKTKNRLLVTAGYRAVTFFALMSRDCKGAVRSLCFVLPLGLLLTGCASEKPLPMLGEIPQFELLNQHGQKFTRTALDGRVWVADFIYTNCEGPCPRMSSRMHAIQKATSAGVKLVSFSVDPARDTPQALSDYGRKFAADDARWTFLTGDPAVLDMLDHDAFKLGNLGAAMDHSTRFVLVDKKGRVRGYYSLGESDGVSRVAKDAARLESET
jgi:protein SCO1/2